MVYKLLRAPEWEAARRAGVFAGSAADKADGFIHLSAASQMRGTAEKHFAGESGLVLAEVDPALLGAPLRWEVSRGGAEFPHLYGVLPMGAVVRYWQVPPFPDIPG